MGYIRCKAFRGRGMKNQADNDMEHDMATRLMYVAAPTDCDVGGSGYLKVGMWVTSYFNEIRIASKLSL